MKSCVVFFHLREDISNEFIHAYIFLRRNKKNTCILDTSLIAVNTKAQIRLHRLQFEWAFSFDIYTESTQRKQGLKFHVNCLPGEWPYFLWRKKKY